MYNKNIYFYEANYPISDIIIYYVIGRQKKSDHIFRREVYILKIKNYIGNNLWSSHIINQPIKLENLYDQD